MNQQLDEISGIVPLTPHGTNSTMFTALTARKPGPFRARMNRRPQASRNILFLIFLKEYIYKDQNNRACTLGSKPSWKQKSAERLCAVASLRSR